MCARFIGSRAVQLPRAPSPQTQTASVHLKRAKDDIWHPSPPPVAHAWNKEDRQSSINGLRSLSMRNCGRIFYIYFYFLFFLFLFMLMLDEKCFWLFMECILIPANWPNHKNHTKFCWALTLNNLSGEQCQSVRQRSVPLRRWGQHKGGRGLSGPLCHPK